jgi:glycosyltransferase involved in cell wall biosynthesis
MTRNPALFEFMGYEIKAKTTTTGYIFSGDYVFLPIFKVIEKQYDGIVYNLEVENSNSYVANGVIVHNCITAVECQYADVPIIANKYAGLTTTLGDSAILLGDGNSHWPYTLEGRKQFLDKTLSLLTNGDKWSEWSTKGIENAKRYSWKNCALRWKKLFETGE